MEVLEAVKTEVDKIEEKAVAVVEEVKAEVKKVEERVRVDINDTEKLLVTRTENDFLKAQVEIQQLNARIVHLQDVAKKCGEKFTADTTALAKKYEVDLKNFYFNNIEQAFMKNHEQAK